MAEVETFFIQPFHINRKRLAPSQRVASKTRHHALADGRRIAMGKAGAAVMRVVADDETGELSKVEVLERYGDIPEEFEEQIRAL